ncbi:TetR/AcrR family transcriptional regulator [Arthrobacter sp. I2-34]|uniref:TetR/AcrR family transcriptional regulator n=1 Tax=Arthrobacter hankyongi TaxID=2904801 RepID=A0ABS9L3M1_9MICC|nr:TetR/AcrR family transcriptional regulator [Arthrobacter hankyongi]MCG2621242.1 TetR/AcrR family transcriptional regulator [Arthrobacter hankyongi]
MSTSRTMRADARKNYEALIKTARKHLSSQGVTTSLDAIAREAGVGVGTLYRHFPDRDHLIFAALNAQGEELRTAADLIRSAETGLERLERWLAQVQNYLSSYQGLPDSIAQALESGDKTPLAITCQEIIEITDGILADAQQEGTVRPGIKGQDLFETTLMTAWLISQEPERQRGLGGVGEILRHGYRS